MRYRFSKTNSMITFWIKTILNKQFILKKKGLTHPETRGPKAAKAEILLPTVQYSPDANEPLWTLFPFYRSSHGTVSRRKAYTRVE
jgi:hypothetical protein